MNQELGLSLVASEFNISEGYLSYLFKEETGQNFTDLVEHVRMDEACKLLQKTKLNINEIYMKVGYSNVQSFRRAFKRIKGVSPMLIRNGTV
jgi:AraC-like DNA-binding protein